MRRMILTLALLCGVFLAVQAGDTGNIDTSYEQMLRHITPDATGVHHLAGETSTAPQDDQRFWVTVDAANKYERTRLLEDGLDIVEIEATKVSGFAHANMLADFKQRRSAPVVRSAVPLKDYLATVSKDLPAVDSAYHNYSQTTLLLRSMAANNSDIASLFSIGKTVEGRDIWCLRLNSSAKGTAVSAKPGAFFLGNMHAREHLANEVPLLLAAWLLEKRNDAALKKYLDTLDIYIVPMNNPDGAEFDIKTGSYQMYRKNMAKNSNGSTGVDLNRNYDSWWCEQGASHSSWSDTYCGPKAFSEPESRAIKAFFEARPNLKTHISYHSYASTILYPWGGSEEEIDNVKDRNAFVKIAREMGKLNGYHPEKASEMYIATGESCDWAYKTTGVFAFTFELEGNGFYPGAPIITRAVEKNIKAALYLLSVTDNPYKVL